MATKKVAAKKTAAKAPANPAAAPVKTVAKKTAAKSVATKTPANEAALGTTHEAPKAKKTPSHAEISKLAHKYWEERGGHHGSHHDDWLRAVKELGA